MMKPYLKGVKSLMVKNKKKKKNTTNLINN
jgi:hypothetical protein